MNKWAASLAIATFGAILPPAFAGDASTPPVSDSTPADGLVELSAARWRRGIGYTWGSGSLTFNNQQAHFSINGLSIVDVGASSYSPAAMSII